MGNVDERRAVCRFARADVREFLIGVVLSGMTHRTAITLGYGLAVLALAALEDRFAALLRRSQFAVGQPVTVGPQRNGRNVRDEIGQVGIAKSLRAEEEALCAGAALRIQIGVAAVP